MRLIVPWAGRKNIRFGDRGDNAGSGTGASTTAADAALAAATAAAAAASAPVIIPTVLVSASPSGVTVAPDPIVTPSVPVAVIPANPVGSTDPSLLYAAWQQSLVDLNNANVAAQDSADYASQAATNAASIETLLDQQNAAQLLGTIDSDISNELAQQHPEANPMLVGNIYVPADTTSFKAGLTAMSNQLTLELQAGTITQAQFNQAIGQLAAPPTS